MNYILLYYQSKNFHSRLRFKNFLGFDISEKIDEAVDAYRSDHPEKDEHFSLLANEVYSGIEIIYSLEQL